MDLINTGKYIAELRKKNSMTQEQLADKLGVTNKTVSRWETGTYMPPADILLKMSELFGVSINEILIGQNVPEGDNIESVTEDVSQIMKESSFTINDRMEFFRKKWLKDHRFELILVLVCIVAVLVTAIITQKTSLLPVSSIFVLSTYIIINNTMSAYIERHAFDGRSQISS